MRKLITVLFLLGTGYASLFGMDDNSLSLLPDAHNLLQQCVQEQAKKCGMVPEKIKIKVNQMQTKGPICAIIKSNDFKKFNYITLSSSFENDMAQAFSKNDINSLEKRCVFAVMLRHEIGHLIHDTGNQPTIKHMMCSSLTALLFNDCIKQILGKNNSIYGNLIFLTSFGISLFAMDSLLNRCKEINADDFSIAHTDDHLDLYCMAKFYRDQCNRQLNKDLQNSIDKYYSDEALAVYAKAIFGYGITDLFKNEHPNDYARYKKFQKAEQQLKAKKLSSKIDWK